MSIEHSMRLAADTRTHHRLRWGLCAAILTTAAIPAAGWLVDVVDRHERADVADARPTGRLPITALGRVQPQDGILAIAAPASASTPAIVAALHVREGDSVQRGQILATLRGREALEAALTGKQRRVAIARARLHALTSGGKRDDLAAQRASVQREEATVAHEEAETERSVRLHGEGLVASAALQTQQSRLIVAVRSLEGARARLDGLSSVRPADVAVATAELRAAEADVDEVHAQLESTVVRAPSDGRVLAIYAHVGQSVGNDGLLAFGKTAAMFVDAEVLEEDLPRARVGQAVRITGDVLPGAIAGTVDEIGVLVGSREVFTNDPTAFADARVVHVKIRVESPELLTRFINARVTTVIAP
jgi:HlyD family secretion protein